MKWEMVSKEKHDEMKPGVRDMEEVKWTEWEHQRELIRAIKARLQLEEKMRKMLEEEEE